MLVSVRSRQVDSNTTVPKLPDLQRMGPRHTRGAVHVVPTTSSASAIGLHPPRHEQVRFAVPQTGVARTNATSCRNASMTFVADAVLYSGVE